MKRNQTLWAVLFAAMLAMTGCGDEGSTASGGGSGGTAGSGGSAGTGGTAGSAGMNGGTSNSTCEAICSSSCAYEGVDPEGQQCLTNCQVGFAQFDDDCGPQMDAFLNCIEAVNCDPQSNECQNQAVAWGLCIAGM